MILYKLLFSILFQPFIIYILMRTIGSCWVQIKMLFSFILPNFSKIWWVFTQCELQWLQYCFFNRWKKTHKMITVHVLMWYVVIWLITYTSQVPCTCIGYVCVISHNHFTNSLFNNTTKYIVCPGNDIMKHFWNFPNFNHS